MRLLVAAICLCSLSQPVHAADFFCATVACLVDSMLRARATPEADTITLTQPVFTFATVNNTTLGATALPLVTTDVLIKGNGARLERAAGAQCFRFFAVSKGRLTLRDMELTRGCGDQEGGAIVGRKSALELSRVRFVLNSALDGGAIALEEGSLLSISNEFLGNGLDDNERSTGGAVKLTGAAAVFNLATFTANAAFPGLGGAVTAWHGSTVDFNGVVRGNRARHGGAFHVYASTLRISGSRIENNTAILTGGGIRLEDSALEMSSSTVAANRTTSTGSVGGGISLSTPLRSVIRNSAIFLNTAGRRGGGLEMGALVTDTENLRIYNTTIARNRADYGGGIALSGRARAQLFNVTLARNNADIGDAIASFDGAFAFTINSIIGNDELRTEASNCFAELEPAVRAAVSWGYNIGEDASCDLIQVGDRQSISAGLGSFTSTTDPGRNHFPIGLGGPAVNAGNSYVCMSTPDLSRDQLGTLRSDGRCDIGAIEFWLDVLP